MSLVDMIIHTMISFLLLFLISLTFLSLPFYPFILSTIFTLSSLFQYPFMPAPPLFFFSHSPLLSFPPFFFLIFFNLLFFLLLFFLSCSYHSHYYYSCSHYSYHSQSSSFLSFSSSCSYFYFSYRLCDL